MVNIIEPQRVALETCHAVTDQQEIAERYQEFLGDESRMKADSVGALYFPENIQQVAATFSALTRQKQHGVISGGRTGISGAVAPVDADAVVSLIKMNRILALGKINGQWYLRAEPGISLAEIAEALDKKTLGNLPDATADEIAAAEAYSAGDEQLWFPVDPTEMTAHLGGVVANNASGARTYHYGSTRDWVRGLKVALADGRTLAINRGEVTADGLSFQLTDENGTLQEVALPKVTVPSTKNTLGYQVKPGMDLVDLFVGSEGTLGALCQIEIALAAKPASILGVLAVVDDEDKALDLVINARGNKAIHFTALEYFDHDTLMLLKQKKDEDGPGSHIPDIPSWDGAAVYLEIAGSEEETEEACEALEELLATVGSSIDETWAAMEPDEIEAQKLFRHTVPETVNLHVGQRASQVPGLHKVGTDMAVPDDKLKEVFAMYRQGLAGAGLDSVVFGHIGNNHVHVNILPKDLGELGKAKELYASWATQVVAMGGAVAAEHGIGRIKRGMLEIQYDQTVLMGFVAIRKAFDPAGTLSPGVLV